MIPTRIRGSSTTYPISSPFIPSLSMATNTRDTDSKWKESYHNIQRISQQQKHELEMLKIEADSYKRRNESLTKSMDALKLKVQSQSNTNSNSNSHPMSQSNPCSTSNAFKFTASDTTTISREMKSCTSTSTLNSKNPLIQSLDQKNVRKIANLEYDNKCLKESNLSLKEEITEQRRQNVVHQSTVHILENKTKELTLKNTQLEHELLPKGLHHGLLKEEDKIYLYDIKKAITSSREQFDAMKYRSVLTEAMKSRMAHILNNVDTVCNNLENGFYVPLNPKIEGLEHRLKVIKRTLCNLKDEHKAVQKTNKELNERNNELMTTNSAHKKHVDAVSVEIAKLRTRRKGGNQKMDKIRDELNVTKQRVEEQKAVIEEYQSTIEGQRKMAQTADEQLLLLNKELQQLTDSYNQKADALQSIASSLNMQDTNAIINTQPETEQSEKQWVESVVTNITTLLSNTDDLHNEIEDLKRDKNELQLQLYEMEEIKVELSSKIRNFESNMASSQSQVDSECAVKQQLLSTLTEIKDDYTSLQSEYQGLSTEYERLQNVNQSLESQLERETATNQKSENEEKEENLRFQDVETLRNELDDKLLVITELESHLSEAHEMTLQCEGMANEVNKLKREADLVIEENCNLQKEIQNLETRNSDLVNVEKENVILKTNLDETDWIRTEHKRLKQENLNLKNTMENVQDLKQRASLVVQECEELRAENQWLQNTKQKLDQRLSNIGSMVDTLQSRQNDGTLTVSVSDDITCKESKDAQTETTEMSQNAENVNNQNQEKREIQEQHHVTSLKETIKTQEVEIERIKTKMMKMESLSQQLMKEKELTYRRSIDQLREELAKENEQIVETLKEDIQSQHQEIGRLEAKWTMERLVAHSDSNTISKQELEQKEREILRLKQSSKKLESESISLMKEYEALNRKYMKQTRDMESLQTQVDDMKASSGSTSKSENAENSQNSENIKLIKDAESASEQNNYRRSKPTPVYMYKLNELQIEKLRKIQSGIVSSKQCLNDIQSSIDLQPISDLFESLDHTLRNMKTQQNKEREQTNRITTNQEVRIQTNCNLSRNEDHVPSIRIPETNVPSIATNQHVITPIQPIKMYHDNQSNESIPRKTKHSMMKKFIEIQQETHHDPNTTSLPSLDSMRNCFNAINPVIPHHPVQVQDHNHYEPEYYHRSISSHRSHSKPSKHSNYRIAIQPLSSEDLIIFIQTLCSGDESFNVLLNYLDRIKLNGIDGATFLSMTPYSMKYIGVSTEDIVAFSRCLSILKNDSDYSMNRRPPPQHPIDPQSQSQKYSRRNIVSAVRVSSDEMEQHLESEMQQMSVSERIAILHRDFKDPVIISNGNGNTTTSTQSAIDKSPPLKKRKMDRKRIKAAGRNYSSLTDLPTPETSFLS